MGRSHCHIIDRRRDTVSRYLLALWCDEDFRHKVDNVSCGKMSSCLFVVALTELPDKFLENVSHIHGTDFVRSHIRLLGAELRNDVIQDTVVGEFGDFLVEVELLDNIYYVR